MPLLPFYDSKVDKYNAMVDGLVKEAAPLSTLSIKVHYAGRKLIGTLEKGMHSATKRQSILAAFRNVHEQPSAPRGTRQHGYDAL